MAHAKLTPHLDATMQVVVKTISSRTYTLEAHAKATVLECKQLLEPMVADGSDASCYTLLYLGNVLNDGDMLMEPGYAEREDDFVVLVQRKKAF